MRLYSGYFALVIGCANYQNGWPVLPNPTADVEEVAGVLRNMGFQVRTVMDPDSEKLRREIINLVTDRGQDPELAILLYFAGHGYTLTQADGAKLGYIVPIDAPDPKEDLAGFMERAISMRYIQQISTSIRAKHVLMCFDSCFSGAIFSLIRGMPSQFIKEQVAKPVRAFITAGDENEQVPDKSVFKTVFLQGLVDSYADSNGDGYITGQELGAYVQESVINYSEGSQHPQFGKIRNPKLDKGDFVFVKKGPESPPQLLASVPRGRMEPPAIVVEEGSVAVGNLAYTSNLDKIAFDLAGQTFQTKRGKWLTIKKLPIGSYLLTIQQAGYLPWQQKVDVKVGETSKVMIWLEKDQSESERKSTQAAAPSIASPSSASPSTPLTRQSEVEAAAHGGATVPSEMIGTPAERVKTSEQTSAQPVEPILALPEDRSAVSLKPLQGTPPLKQPIIDPSNTEIAEPSTEIQAAKGQKEALQNQQDQEQQRLNGLLAQAVRAYRENRLTTPAGNAALDYYREALHLAEQNTEAYQGMLDVVAKYLLWAEKALDNHQATAAESYLESAQTVLTSIPEPTPNECKDQLAKIRNQREQLQIKVDQNKAQARLKPKSQASHANAIRSTGSSKRHDILKEELYTEGQGEKKQAQTNTINPTVTPNILKERLY